MTEFRSAESQWIERLDNLRNVIRQEVISRQLATYVRAGMNVLDVGCGQGTQALRLASAGCHVTGVDPSEELLQICAEQASASDLTVELLHGHVETLDRVLGDRRFDLVCCHGVMMYLDNRVRALTSLADRLAKGSHLSVTFRNGHALAMRPGIRRDWSAALSAFESKEYVNELGLPATADHIGDIDLALDAAGLRMVTWRGVRVFNDAISADALPPGVDELQLLLEAEERAGAIDPYRWMASQLHVVAELAPT
ncbi:MAG TPA: class I SAM-dependent methyltransferase [Acidimicrobiales bacterium]